MEGKKRLKAVLLADVVESTIHISRDAEGTIQMLSFRREIFQDYTNQHNGKIQDTTGDSILAMFDSVTDAVNASLAIQGHLKNQPIRVIETVPMHFRIGIDLGELVEHRQGELFGLPINVASRLQEKADTGGICISFEVFRNISGLLQNSFQFIGELNLDNLDFPVRAYKNKSDPTPSSKADEKESKYFPESHIPIVGGKVTDLDWNRFMKHAFGVIRNHFQQNLSKLKAQGQGVDIDFQSVHERMFITRVYVSGEQEAYGRIWSSSFGGSRELIYYSTQDAGPDVQTGWNESISPAHDRNRLALSAMGHQFGSITQGFDQENLSPEEAAEYLWRLFVQHLG